MAFDAGIDNVRLRRHGELVDLSGCVLDSSAMSYHPDRLIRQSTRVLDVYDLIAEDPYATRVSKFINENRTYLNVRHATFFSKKQRQVHHVVPSPDSDSEQDQPLQPSDVEIILRPLANRYARRARSTFASDVVNRDHDDDDDDSKEQGADPSYVQSRSEESDC